MMSEYRSPSETMLSRNEPVVAKNIFSPVVGANCLSAAAMRDRAMAFGLPSSSGGSGRILFDAAEKRHQISARGECLGRRVALASREPMSRPCL